MKSIKVNTVPCVTPDITSCSFDIIPFSVFCGKHGYDYFDSWDNLISKGKYK